MPRRFAEEHSEVLRFEDPEFRDITKQLAHYRQRDDDEIVAENRICETIRHFGLQVSG